MSSPNVKLRCCCIQPLEKLVFSVSCSLSAGLVPLTNKLSFIQPESDDTFMDVSE
ncbi:BgTH12-06686 [Blumeria graminis f. sp. triticale]|uniref:BgTH12-06686 n=1 Tax=Blumeria graminis f. sp. triticale TaxID=1689686 RepID=A0A9W4D458_BLUGR|nr:BgTH12-06686 [Blumeria graminis f. sp. triticale]